MNEASERDPFNNNSYGTLVDAPYKTVDLPVLDVADFNESVIRGYEDGSAPGQLPADVGVARSLIPAGTATLRDFSYIAPEIPEYLPQNCTGCMDCVTQCPDTAILGKVLSEPVLEQKLQSIADEQERDMFEKQWSRTRKYYDAPKKKGKDGGRFAILIDPSKCKGCAECVTVCDDLALEMIPKSESTMENIRKSHRHFKEFGPSDDQYINDNLLIDNDAQGEHPHLRRRRRLLRRMRRGLGAADAVRRHRRQARRPVGHHRRHRLQHRVHIHVSLQSLPCPVDEFIV